MLAQAVISLKALNINHRTLTKQQILTILTAFIKGTQLDINRNALSRVDPGLLARALNNLEVLEVKGTELSKQDPVDMMNIVIVIKK